MDQVEDFYQSEMNYFILMKIGGSYSLFAGRDATRALSKMQLTQTLFPDEYDELTDLTDNERATARNWHEDFRGMILYQNSIQRCFFCFIEKYDIVGRLLKPGEKPGVYPIEESTTDDNGIKKNE
jgi:membrane-associated progesterone receptor component